MKKLLWCLMIGVLSLATVQTASEARYVSIKKLPVIAQGAFPKLVDDAVVDTFDDGRDPNYWLGWYDAFSANGATVKTEYDAVERMGDAGYGYKIIYNVEATNSYSGVAINLAPKDMAANVSAYTYVTFWVKGSVSGIPLKIELQTAKTKGMLYVCDYLDGGITTEWQQVKIPIRAFANVSTVTAIQKMVFVFENAYATKCNAPLSGTMYVDSISWGKTELLPVRIDHGPDAWGLNAMGGNNGNLNNHGLMYDPRVYDGFSNGLSSLYTLPNEAGSWCGFFMIFGGGTTGWVATPNNLSGYTKLTFSVKASSDTIKPAKVKIEINDNRSTVPKYYLTNLTTEWQTRSIPLSSFSPAVRISTIKQLAVIYEYDTIGKSKSGIIHFDKMQFEK